jgi:hypothetical protein
MDLLDFLRRLTRRTLPRPDENTVHASVPIYVRGSLGSVVRLEVAPRTTAYWATARALIALDDPRDAERCALMFHRAPLQPRRSLLAKLAASGAETCSTSSLRTRFPRAATTFQEHHTHDTPLSGGDRLTSNTAPLLASVFSYGVATPPAPGTPGTSAAGRP